MDELKREVNRLRYWVRTYEHYIEELQELLDENDIEYPPILEE